MRLAPLYLLLLARLGLAVPIEFTFTAPAGKVTVNGGAEQVAYIRLVLKGDTNNLVRGRGLDGSDVYRGLSGTLTVLDGAQLNFSRVRVTTPVDVNFGFPQNPDNNPTRQLGAAFGVGAEYMAVSVGRPGPEFDAFQRWNRVSPVGPLSGGAFASALRPALTLASGQVVRVVTLDGQAPFSRASFQAALSDSIKFTFSSPSAEVVINGAVRTGVELRLVLDGVTNDIERGTGISESDRYRELRGTITVTGNGANISNVGVASPVDVNIGFPRHATPDRRNVSVSFNFFNENTSQTVQSPLIALWDGVSTTCPLPGIATRTGPVTLSLVNGTSVVIRSLGSSAAFEADRANSPPLTCAVISAGSFGASDSSAPGGWTEIYGKNLAAATTDWGRAFVGGRAPTRLGGVQVLFGGTPAFLSFVSPTQINAQVPDGLTAGDVNVGVTNAGTFSELAEFTIAARAPRLLAPPEFFVGGRQHVAALNADNTFVGPVNLIQGAPFRPARAGERVILYGIGFGAANPASAAGQIVAAPLRNLPNVTVNIGGRAAVVDFAGLAPGFVGLYQFNVGIPAGVPPGNAALAVSVAGVRVNQNLVLAVQ